MAVEVSPLNILGGGTPAVTGFSDTMATAPAFARNAISPPSDDWLWTPLSGDSPLATPTATGLFSFGVALPAGGGNGLQVSTLQWAINPLYELTCGIVPVVCYTKSLYYAAQKKFVQVQYNNGSGTIAFALGWMNYIDLSGSGAAGNQNFNHDGYAIRLDTRGLLQRWNSGVSGPTGLHADLGGITQGDVHRLSIDQTVGGQVSLTYTLNGVAQYTFVDNTASRVANQLFPFIGYINTGAGGSGGLKNFSCGLGL